MFVPLPNLDDRRWTDLTDEGRALIPIYSPDWTDHNAHDPGVTLMELFAWIAETDIYRANRIPDAHIREFLELLGLPLRPPQPAHAVVQFQLKPETERIHLPKTTELGANLLDGSGVFRLQRDLWVLGVSLAAVQTEISGQLRDLTTDWRANKPLAIFGDNPIVGDALYLGFDALPPSQNFVSLYLAFAGEDATDRRRRVAEEAESFSRACDSSWNGCGQQVAVAQPPLPHHHSASTVWEIQAAPGLWQRLDVEDETRAMTLDGAIRFLPPETMTAARTGINPKQLYYVRCRLASGALDAAPIATRILENAVEVEQSAPLSQRWPIATGVIATGNPPAPGLYTRLSLDVNASGQISRLEFLEGSAAGYPRIRLLSYQPATDSHEGSLILEALRIGVGSGAPNQAFGMSGPQICADGFELFSLEQGLWKQWLAKLSLLASGPADSHFVLHAGAASVSFGDGRNGRVPPVDAILVAIARSTAGEMGNVAKSAINSLPDTPHNTAVLGDVYEIRKRLARIGNPDPALGGSPEETLAHAQGRAAQILEQPARAVTLGDCETLALQTPGVRIARAIARANHHPGFRCYAAPGFITVVIVPELPAGRPMPSAGLLRAVSLYVNRRRVVGTRLEITGPEYLEVAAITKVRAYTGQNKAAVRERVAEALKKFLDPLKGGPEGTGWPLGRDVYVSEVLQTIDGAPGVDHVLSLELQTAGCGRQCGNLCVGPLALVVSGAHQVEVV